jgi:hypothetical protein
VEGPESVYLEVSASVSDGATRASSLYRLVEDESQREILTALDLDGFFVEGSGQAPPYVHIFGTSLQPESRPTRFHDVELQVLDLRGEVIGEYYVGEAQLIESRPSREGAGTDVAVSFLGYRCPFPYAGEIWRRWACGAPLKRGEWRHLSAKWHPSWLHVVQTAWFQAGRMATRYEPNSLYVLDGDGVTSISGFYCELGEAINGPGGYFGSGLDSLSDCLRNAVAGDRLFEIAWPNFDLLEEIGKAELNSIAALLREFGVGLLTQKGS